MQLLLQRRWKPIFRHLVYRRQIVASYALIIFLSAIYAVAALRLPTGAFFVQDAQVKFLQTRALASSAWQNDGIADPARAVDPSRSLSPLRPSFAGHFFYYRNGFWYGKYPLAFAILASIPYYLTGMHGLVIMSVLPALFCLLFTFYAAQLLPIRRPIIAVFLMGVGTPLAFYAAEFWEHTLGLALTLIAILCTLREQPLRPPNVILGGLAIGVSVWFRTELIYLAPAIALALLGAARRDYVRAGLIFCLSLAISLLPLIVTNWVLTGTLIGAQVGTELQVEARQGDILAAIQGQITTVWMMLSPSRFKTGWLIMTPLALLATLVVWAWSGRAAALRTAGFLLLACTCLALLWGLRSTSIYNYPIDLLSAGGVIALAVLFPLYQTQAWRRHAQVVRLIILGSVFAGLVLLSIPHFGGQQWGPRYLLPVYPILVLLGTLGLEQLLEAPRGRERTTMLALSGLLIVLSLGISIQGITYITAWRQLHLSTVMKLAQLPPTVVITDTHVLPFTIASILNRHVLLGIENAEQVRLANQLLQNHNHDNLVWVSTSTPFPHNWQDQPVPAGLNHELEQLGWIVVGETTVDQGGYQYTHYHRGSVTLPTGQLAP
jgi:hypothetical protein